MERLVTPIGPPKLAPKEVPPNAALYLDNAAEYLTTIAKDFGLDLQPYELYEPGHSSWFHGLYGETNDRQFYLRVMTDEDLAPAFKADLIGYVRLHARPGQLVYPREDGLGDWIVISRLRVKGMAELMTEATDMAQALRLACVYRMPNPTDPDPKA